MTTAALDLSATPTAPLPAAIARRPFPDAPKSSCTFYRQAAELMRGLIRALDGMAPPNVTNDPVWQDVVTRAVTASANDVDRPSVILGLTCLFDPGLVIEAIGESIGEVPA